MIGFLSQQFWMGGAPGFKSPRRAEHQLAGAVHPEGRSWTAGGIVTRFWLAGKWGPSTNCKPELPSYPPPGPDQSNTSVGNSRDRPNAAGVSQPLAKSYLLTPGLMWMRLRVRQRRPAHHHHARSQNCSRSQIHVL